ncbi:hypothetical protein SAMN05421882_103515 [Nitrosomonas communis]|uniref:DUF4139 domain-containing protein n=2 Tax=Nitrosomonas communis TaxID=44574 RepID=A0A1H2X6K5_9PROT|nr:hypothetical protein SAMN05421882_103515 [Nitrosomonas communis]
MEWLGKRHLAADKKYSYKKNRCISILLAIAVMSISISISYAAAITNERVTTSQDQKNIIVTIYNGNLALIKDSRSVILDQAFNKLAWQEVSARIRPETALLRNLAYSSGFRLLEQSFDFDVLTPEKLLEKYSGKEVTVIRTDPATGSEASEVATILSTNEGIILKFIDRVESSVPGRIVFPGVPENLRDRPTLLISLISQSQGKHDLELSYLTSGLSWSADYVADLNADNDWLDLNGLITFTNQSGIAYHNARLQLVAGDVHQIYPEQPTSKKMMTFAREVADSAPMKKEALFEYHLYTSPHPITLAENQTKQVALMSATHIPVSKEFILQGKDYYYSGQYPIISHKLKTNVSISFANKGEGLGMPLPKGIIRVYKKDTQGNHLFIGEDQIDHIPQNELVRLSLGSTLDITTDKLQTDFQQISGALGHSSIVETAYQITLRNAKKEAVIVKIQEPIPGDWTMLSESLPHIKLSSGMAEWRMPVPAENEATLTYRVRVKY